MRKGDESDMAVAPLRDLWPNIGTEWATRLQLRDCICIHAKLCNSSDGR